MVSRFYVVLVNMRYDKFLQKFSDEENFDCAMESHAENVFFLLITGWSDYRDSFQEINICLRSKMVISGIIIPTSII